MRKISSLFSKRVAMAGLLAGSAILAASTFAMSGAGPGLSGDCPAWQGKALEKDRFKTRRDQRLASLKDKLKLQPGQEVAWQTFTQAVPGKGTLNRDEGKAQRQSFVALTTPERMDKMLARVDQRRAQMAERALAVKTFYVQLSPEQQKVFDTEAMILRQGPGHHGHRHPRS